MNVNDPLDLDGTAQAELVRDGSVSADELLELTLERIDRLNPVLNCVVDRFEERARARLRDRPPAGPFAGVPFLVKDLVLEIEGTRFTEGSALLAEHVSTHTQELARRYEDRAGLVIAGKTNTPELGMSATTEPRLFGPTRNPWDVSLTAGGSSGGSAAAVASRIVAMAHGNDLLGSLRSPAACCGVVALKPTRARNPLGPAYRDFGAGFAVEHAITRSVRDTARLLDCTAGPMPGDPYPAPPLERPLAAELERPPGPMRIAVSVESPTGSPVMEQVRRSCLAIADACEALGHHVDHGAPDVFDDRWHEALMLVAGAATACAIGYWERILGVDARPHLEPTTRAVYELTAAITAKDHLLAVLDIQQRCRTAAAFFASHDVWLTRVLAHAPPAIGDLLGTDDDLFAGRVNAAHFAPFTSFANATGNPAIVLPLSTDSNGLPSAVQFTAGFGDEASLVRLGHQLEQAHPWAHRRPPHAI